MEKNRRHCIYSDGLERRISLRPLSSPRGHACDLQSRSEIGGGGTNSCRANHRSVLSSVVTPQDTTGTPDSSQFLTGNFSSRKPSCHELTVFDALRTTVWTAESISLSCEQSYDKTLCVWFSSKPLHSFDAPSRKSEGIGKLDKARLL